MKSRTAVQILFDDINFGLRLWIESEITDKEFFEGLIQAYKDALEFEKEQIQNAWLVDGYTDISNDNWIKEFEEYYNETFKNTNDETI